MGSSKHNTADILWQGPGSEVEVLWFHTRQVVSQPFVVRAEIKSTDMGLVFSDMLRADAEIVLKCGEDLSDERRFAGIITSFAQQRSRHGDLPNASSQAWHYRLEIRPKLWLLSKRFTSKVFQKKTVKDIVDEVLGDHGVACQWLLSATPPTREYCVQYQESDLDFVSRLLEDEGICYFFDHDQKKVVFCDDIASHPTCKPIDTTTYSESRSPSFRFGKHEYIQDFDYQETIGTGKYEVHHYNYETSQIKINADDTESNVPGFDDLESYQHSHNYIDKGAGKAYATRHKERQTAEMKLGSGKATARSFEAGYLFTMEKHFRTELNVQWLLTACEITGEQGKYGCTFEALPADKPYRPPRLTPKPRVTGIQTAVVTGPSGTEVYLDDLGRCKLQYHWDREGENNDRSSMWVRVSNNYAGKDYGVQWIPRVGHEVLVDFINGDPDLPVVTGRVYNDFNEVPLKPALKYQNILKTIKDNHILFDDKDGDEKLNFRAQKNMTTTVMNDQSSTIYNDQTLTVKNDRTATVENNRTTTVNVDDATTVGSNRKIDVGADETHTVGSNQSLTVGASRTISVTGQNSTTVNGNISTTTAANESLTVGASRTVNVGASETQNVGSSQAISVGASQTINVGVNQAVSAGAAMTLSAGATITIGAGGALTLSAGGSTVSISGAGITLQAGGSVINMTPATVMVNSPIVKIN